MPAEPSTNTKQLEHERSAAEAALAQCVREYAKERAQKVRLQQQIGALQKRLLQTQVLSPCPGIARVLLASPRCHHAITRPHCARDTLPGRALFAPRAVVPSAPRLKSDLPRPPPTGRSTRWRTTS